MGGIIDAVGDIFDGGSGDKTTTTASNTYDPVASAKMADIAERKQKMAEEQWQMYKDYFQEYEIETAKANRGLLPAATELAKTNLERSKPVTEKFYDQVMSGVDVGRRMDEAQADVMSSVKLGEGVRRREASRYGINPNSTAFGNAVNTGALDTARRIAGARTSARNTAEAENFSRLGLAIGRGTPPATVTPNADPYARADATFSGAAATYAPLASRVLSSTRTTSTPGATIWDFAGDVMGTFAGNYAGAKGAKLGGM